MRHTIMGGPPEDSDDESEQYALVDPVPHYSTDPTASDALLDKMAELGWDFLIMRHCKDGGKVEAVFDKDDFDHCEVDEHQYYQAEADTMRLAIALAAKAALDSVTLKDSV
jgi:hypothetical protein